MCCSITVVKIKDYEVLKKRYLHDYRIIPVGNADIEKKNLNNVIINCVGKDGSEVDYSVAVRDRIESARSFRRKRNMCIKKQRIDAVIALDLLISFGNYFEIIEKKPDIDKLAKKSREFVELFFNKAQDEKSNIISMVMHVDEAVPHVHCIIVPISETNSLSSKNYINGPGSLCELQDALFSYFEDQGMVRGAHHSTLKHVSNRAFRAEIRRILKLTDIEPMEWESGIDYKYRLDMVLEQYRKEAIEKLMQELRIMRRDNDTLISDAWNEARQGIDLMEKRYAEHEKYRIMLLVSLDDEISKKRKKLSELDVSEINYENTESTYGSLDEYYMSVLGYTKILHEINEYQNELSEFYGVNLDYTSELVN